MSHRSNTRLLRDACETLRVLCPTDKPVVVVRAKMPDGDFGDCALGKHKGRKVYKIRLNSALPWDFQQWVLIHEWAHAMTWPVTHSRHDDHGSHFGIAYAEAYQAIYPS
jgi:hypothetical protein